jgi:integrase
MASVIQVNGKWRAQVRRSGFKDECSTHRTKAAAEAWVRRIHAAQDRGEVGSVASGLTVDQVLTAYEELRATSRPISDSSNEHYMLKALRRGLGKKVVAKLTTDDLVEYANMRKGEGAGPYTLNMDFSKLGTALRYGSASLKAVLPDVVGTARPTLTYLRLIGGGGKRERRPTEDEYDRLVSHIHERYGVRFRDAVRFASVTAFRRGEITDLKWADINVETRMATVLRKHPRKGKVQERVPLLPLAWAILEAQPRDDERVFPFSGSTLSKYFTNSCRALSIPDLHLHDMRHEATSTLFEEGYTIEQVALVTGHKDWRNLKRYANLRPEDVHKVVSPASPKRSHARPARPST